MPSVVRGARHSVAFCGAGADCVMIVLYLARHHPPLAPQRGVWKTFALDGMSDAHFRRYPRHVQSQGIPKQNFLRSRDRVDMPCIGILSCIPFHAPHVRWRIAEMSFVVCGIRDIVFVRAG